jgi:hypothetical protein
MRYLYLISLVFIFSAVSLISEPLSYIDSLESEYSKYEDAENYEIMDKLIIDRIAKSLKIPMFLTCAGIETPY